MYWRLFRSELNRWAESGRALNLWWRDDDAREPGPALDRMIGLSARHAAPLTLAVIPDGDRTALRRRLDDAECVCVIQHGVDHLNRRRPNWPCEFDEGASSSAIALAVESGWSRLEGFRNSAKVFAPPWNAAAPGLAAALVDAGYGGWSGYGDEILVGGPPGVNAHVDVLRWQGGPRFRGKGRALNRMLRLIRERRAAEAWDAPLGLLTHHLDMDEAAWLFLERLLAEAAHPGVRWRGAHSLWPTAAQRTPVLAEA